MNLEEEKNRKEQQALTSHWRVKIQKGVAPMEDMEEKNKCLRRGALSASSMQMRFKVDKKKSTASLDSSELDAQSSFSRYHPYERRNSCPSGANTNQVVDPRSRRIQSCPQINLDTASKKDPKELFMALVSQGVQEDTKRLESVRNSRRMGLTEKFLENRRREPPQFYAPPTEPTPATSKDPEMNKLISKFLVYSDEPQATRRNSTCERTPTTATDVHHGRPIDQQAGYCMESSERSPFEVGRRLSFTAELCQRRPSVSAEAQVDRGYCTEMGERRPPFAAERRPSFASEHPQQWPPGELWQDRGYHLNAGEGTLQAERRQSTAAELRQRRPSVSSEPFTDRGHCTEAVGRNPFAAERRMSFTVEHTRRTQEEPWTETMDLSRERRPSFATDTRGTFGQVTQQNLSSKRLSIASDKLPK